jgi:arsenate reductase-like glutaredoxin family protein
VNVQIYVNRKNPDVLKAERFFKERRVPYQLVDLKKHRLGERELALFAKAAGSAAALVDRSGPVAHMTGDALIVSELLSDPSALRSPIVRNGNAVTVGVDEEMWKRWVQAG